MEIAVRLQYNSVYQTYLFCVYARKTRDVFYVDAVRGRWLVVAAPLSLSL